MPVGAPDAGEAAPELGAGYGPERYLAAVGGAEPHVLHVAEGATLLRGIANHHPHVVAAALDALRLLPVERLPHLARQVVQRESERLGRRKDVEDDLPLAGAERIGDVDHAGVAGELELQALGRVLQVGDARPLQLYVDRLANGEQRRRVDQLDCIRHRPDELAPALCHCGGAEVPLLRANQLESHLAQMRAPRRDAARGLGVVGRRRLGRLLPDRRHHVPHQAPPGRRMAGIELGAQARHGGHDLLHRLRGHVGRRALRHGQPGRHVVRLERREEREVHAPARDQREGQQQQRHAGSDGRVAPVGRPQQEAPVAGAHEALQPIGEIELQPIQGAEHAAPGGPARRPLAVAQVRGQHQLRLDQREQQTDDHHQPDQAEDLAHRPGHEEHGGEGRYRGQHPEHDRRGDLVGAPDGPLQAVAHALLVGVDVLADDDGVVDEDPAHENEGEQRARVDRHADHWPCWCSCRPQHSTERRG